MKQPKNAEGPSAVLCALANAVQGALNLSYLIEFGEKRDPECSTYVRMLDETLKRMASLIIQVQKLGIPTTTIH